MQTFRKKIRENPLLGSLIILVLCFACNELVPNVGYLLPDNIVGDYMYEVICMLWPIGLVYVCGYMDIFSKRGLRRTFMAGLPLFLVYGGYLTTSIWKAVFDPKMPLLPAEQIILSIITLIGIGKAVKIHTVLTHGHMDKHRSTLTRRGKERKTVTRHLNLKADTAADDDCAVVKFFGNRAAKRIYHRDILLH